MLCTNEMFSTMTKKGKVEGHGEIESFPSIEAEDFKTLSVYFENNILGPPNADLLQEIVLFNVIYYMGRRDHKNLCRMQVNHFEIVQDP